MFKKEKLKNNITLLMEQMKDTRSVSMYIFVKNGSVNEDKNNNGISHFIEHMLFKGTQKRNASQLAEEMDSIGAAFNAYTSKEHTCYYFKVLDTYFDEALDIISDMYLNPKFDDDDINKEKGVVTEEINMAEDMPDDIIFDKQQLEIWDSSTLGYSILGLKENINKFNHNILKEYYSRHYRTDNTIISAAGNFDYDEMYKKINDKFGEKQPFEYNDTLYSPVLYKKCNTKIEKDIEQLHLCITFPSIDILDKRNYVLTALNTILGGGMSSILFQKIREEKGLAYTVYSFPTIYKGAGLFSIYTALNYEQIKPVLKIIINELNKIKENFVEEKIVNKVKVQIKSSYLLSLENSANRASSLGRSEAILGEIKTTDEIIKKIDEISADDIKLLAKEIFDLDKMSISVVGKVKDVNIDNIINF